MMKLKRIARFVRAAALALVTVTYAGLEYQARYTNQSTVGAWKWIAIGTGSTAEDPTQTALVTELTGSGVARALATLSYEASYKSVWDYTFTNNTGGALGINEAGIFDQLAVGGHMLMRHLFPSTKNIGIGETLEVTMKLAQST
jgi:hypothetical protein